MKKLKLALIAVIISAGTFGVFAFTDANEPIAEIEASSTMYEWYDGSTYLGLKTIEQQQLECGDPGTIQCAVGYVFDGEGNPIDGPVYTWKE